MVQKELLILKSLKRTGDWKVKLALRMLNFLLFYALELDHVLESLPRQQLNMVCGRLTVQTEASPQNRGIIHALSTIFGEQGSHALHKGWLPSVVVIPYVGLNLAVYESLKVWLIKSRLFGLVEDSELSVTTELGCGDAAGTGGQTVAYLLDVIHQRMQMVDWKDTASVGTT